MCRGGHMFAPTKTFRKWTRRVNPNQQEYAICSAVAASAVPALVMARGHRIQSVNEIPIVVERDFQALKKTRAVFHALKRLKLSADLRRCKVCSIYLFQLLSVVFSCAFIFDILIQTMTNIHRRQIP